MPSGSLLTNSLLVAAATAVLAVFVGALVGVAVVTAPIRLRRALLAAVLVGLALPPFLVVNAWLDLLGAGRGPLRLASLVGTVGVLTLMTWPVATLLAVGAWDRVEAGSLEADPRLRGGALWRWVLWPAARGHLLLAGLIIFVLAFNQFTVPVLLQVPVVSEDLWLALTTRLNAAGAWEAAAPMVVVPVLLLVVLMFGPRLGGWGEVWAGRGRGLGAGTAGWAREAGPVSPEHLARALGAGWRRAAGLATAVMLGVSVGLPLVQLLGTARAWDGLPRLVASSPGVIWNSAEHAFMAASLSVAAGAWLARWRWTGWTWALFFLPGILLGQTFLVLFSGTALAGSPGVVWLALSLRYVALGWHGARLARAAVDPLVVEAGRLEGVRGWALFRAYVWPQLARPVVWTWYAIYLLALWDVETLVLIQPPGGETLALRVFNLLHYGHTADVNAMGVVLLGLAVGPALLGWGVAHVVELRRGPR